MTKTHLVGISVFHAGGQTGVTKLIVTLCCANVAKRDVCLLTGATV